MITIFNDAAGCYGRMHHNLTTITTRRMGCPKEFTLCYARVQNQMQHYVKTKTGVSSIFFQDSPSSNIGGLGQGGQCHQLSKKLGAKRTWAEEVNTGGATAGVFFLEVGGMAVEV